MRPHRGRVLALGALLGAVALWSGSLSIVRIAVESASPGTVTFWRCVVGALVLTGWVVVRSGGSTRVRPHPTERTTTGGRARAWGWAIGSGATCGAAFLLIAAGMRDVGSGPAGIVLSAIPGLTMLLSALEGEGVGIGARHATSLALGGLGALTLALPAGGGWSVVGLVVLALAALAHAATNVTSGHSLERLDPVVVAAISMAVAAVVSAPFASFADVLPLRVVLAIIVLGVFPTGLAYVMYFHGIRVLGTARAAYSNFLVPPVAVAAGMVTLGELPDGATILALALAMVALYVGVGGTDAEDPLSEPASPLVAAAASEAQWQRVARRDSSVR